MHVRLGDDVFHQQKDDNPQLIDNLLSAIEKISTNLEGHTKLVLITDSDTLSKNFKNSKLLTRNVNPVHFGSTPNHISDLLDTLCDFYILLHATKILRYSTYDWGSGFSSVVAEIKKASITDLSISIARS